VPFVFTLCGGHISPILIGAKERGIKVVDCRDERNAVFAADACARMTGRPGVAAVTAGPGVTNAMTALKNAQMAQTPMVLFGGATATILRGRGSLQDIDQLSLMRPCTKWATSVSTVGELGATVEKAFQIAKAGVPGPVFVEVPVDILYPEEIVREWYLKEAGVENATTLPQRALGLYLKGHLYRQFHMPHVSLELPLPGLDLPKRVVADAQLGKVAAALAKARKPALIIGSQTMVGCADPRPVADAVKTLGIPTWLGGGARGLLGRHSDLQFRHARGKALKEADVVIVAGFPFDFRLKYGLGISKKATLISINLSAEELRKNRRPDIAVQMNAADFLVGLAREAGSPGGRWDDWFSTLVEREEARDAEIQTRAVSDGDLVDPIHFFMRLEQKMSDDAVIVADGGDFVATAAYILRPRSPLAWLDPGVFGTLGVGGGFAVGASYVRPGAEVWIIWGDGSCAYSISEFDTYARHGLAPIAVVGTDASWAQIARDQVVILGDDVGTTLLRTAYHDVAEGYGGKGLLLTDPAKIDDTLDEAKSIAAEGKPVLINVHLAASDFRQGSISI
jgi:acetolactate synthase-1/2/3 large subunit